MSDVLELRLAWHQHLGRSPAADQWFDTVVARHREPHRHYHTIRHVRWVVRHVIELAGVHPVDDLGATVAAAFFHDVVYDPSASDNEAASARLARTALDDIGWSDERPELVATLIEATASHQPHGDDESVLLAADLAVLAAEPARYADYTRAVRREYAHIDDAAWRVGRRAVLESFLVRDHIFAPHLQLDAWEQRSRANIAAELATLPTA